jgi:hypothetical protein
MLFLPVKQVNRHHLSPKYMKIGNFCLSIVLTLCLFFPSISHAQFEFGVGYQYSNPRGNMGSILEKPAHGIFTDLAYRIPKTRLAVGMNLAFSQYGFQERQETYQFDNGYEGVVDVEVYNSFTNNSLYLRYNLLDAGLINPYLLAGAGFSRFSTNLTILDPREEFTSDCPKPLETSTLIQDRTSYLLFGGGVMMDFGYLIKSQPKDRYFLDLRLGYQNGGDVRFMTANEPNLVTGNSQEENVYFDFVSEAQPDVVHEYHAGSAYRSAMRFMSFNVGFYMRLGRRELVGL